MNIYNYLMKQGGEKSQKKENRMNQKSLPRLFALSFPL